MGRMVGILTTGSRTGIALLVAVCLAAPALRGQAPPEATAISIDYGGIDGDFALGVRVGTRLTRRMGLEVAAEFVPSRGDFSDLYSRVLFQVFLRPGSRLVPHFSAGAGAATAVGMGNRRTNSEVAFGGGVRARLTAGLAVRIDGEGHVVYLDGKTDLRPGITGGILFLF